MNLESFQTTPGEKKYIRRILASLPNGFLSPSSDMPGTREQRQIGLEAQYKIAKMFYVPFGEVKIENVDEIDLTIKGMKADVKCLLADYDPQPHYSVNIKNYQLQKSKEKDIIIAVMYNRKTETFFIAGWYLINKLKAEWFHYRGEQKIRKEGSTFQYKADTWDIPVSEFRPIDQLR